ncbi:hypothetical protein Baya_6109 [Bagarius yarrelli]|uniref:Secreted protein n=1 Tax=Bagarius yarrelli TaxID=175774 RepID=A0A556U505_BAGYA|nr:hypothetical protein Baya_6109 [Bagarius yarrelli]
MHSRDRAHYKSKLRPFLLGHCFFSSFLLLCQAEPQRSCSQLGSQRRGEHCQSLCQCRYYPPLPPPPPPPPPPRLLIPTGKDWKPLKKQENGTSRGEYAMSCRKKQTANNVVV